MKVRCNTKVFVYTIYTYTNVTV